MVAIAFVTTIATLAPSAARVSSSNDVEETHYVHVESSRGAP